MASNITVSDLVVAPGIQQTYAQWTVDDPNATGLPYLQLDRVELWASTTDNVNTATKVAEGITFANYVYDGFNKRYHWVRARDKEGQYGDWYPSGNGAVTGAVWQDWTPTFTAGSGTITSYNIEYARYFKMGPTVSFNIDVTILDNGTGATYIEFDLPVFAVSSAPLSGFVGDAGASGFLYNGVGYVYRFNGNYPNTASSFSLYIGGTYAAD